jgi:hypothetical protein
MMAKKKNDAAMSESKRVALTLALSSMKGRLNELCKELDNCVAAIDRLSDFLDGNNVVEVTELPNGARGYSIRNSTVEKTFDQDLDNLDDHRAPIGARIMTLLNLTERHCSVSEIADRLQVSTSSVYKHLKELEKSGAIRHRRAWSAVTGGYQAQYVTNDRPR